MLVGMDICLYVRVYVCMDLCMWVCIYVWVYLCRYVGVHVGRKCMRPEICSYGGVFVRGGYVGMGWGVWVHSRLCAYSYGCVMARGGYIDNRDCPVIVTGCAARG